MDQPAALLITQCLQNDFVKPIGRYDPLPNLLHVGFEEARRLMGENPDEGPVARMMRWAYEQGDDELAIIHIRDWHDAASPFQAEHLRQFGPHCLRHTEGARFAFDETVRAGRRVVIVDSLGLNDFVGTALEELLRPCADRPVRVGLVGVWTEAKITFLAYDLRARYPQFDLSVCSALTASSSRAHHFMALEQLRRLLGVKVVSSLGEFTRYLGGANEELSLPQPTHADAPELVVQGRADLRETDRNLIRYLFRDCRSVQLQVLDGGYSGNLVLSSVSVDLLGQTQVAHVVKVGEEVPIGKERAAFEQIESVLGNNAPRIVDFADAGGRGALKYRYAAMGGGFSTTFQKLYCAGLPFNKTRRLLDELFIEQLGRFYAAGTREKCNLLDYYWFRPDLAVGVRVKVEEVMGNPADGPVLRFPGNRALPNVCRFYEHELASLLPLANGSAYFSQVHGDLNGANIIVDAHENVWLIDFFHTHRGHVLKDLIKLENDLLYIFTPLDSETEMEQAYALTDALMLVEDLAREPAAPNIANPNLLRAFDTVRLLRSYYADLIHEDRDPLQLLIGQLRYAMHTLSFDESNLLQKRWALYTSSRCAAAISDRLRRHGPLRVDWLENRHTRPGRLGLTILPGRKDYGRNMANDIATLQHEGITHVLCLISPDEFVSYGVKDLLSAYEGVGFVVRHLPILDQRVCSVDEMRTLAKWLAQHLAHGASILIHCVGGLGRSGFVAACFLKSQGLNMDEALAEVRRARSQRAIESSVQEEFVRQFAL